MVKICFGVLVFIISGYAFGCSFHRPTMLKPVAPWVIESQNETLAQPKVTYSVQRGRKRVDGDSCADTGVLKLNVEAVDDGTQEVGYLITIIDSSEPEITIPNYWLRSEGVVSEYVFPWLDGASNVQESLEITVEVVQIDIEGRMSMPVVVKIKDPGNF